MGFNPLRKLIGDPNARALRDLHPLVGEVNALEPDMAALADEGLRARTAALRARLGGGEEPDAVLAEALAACREAIRRAVGERAYDVQLSGAIALHRGMVAEMRTGEGKTLVATLALYANALGGGAHLVTVNDYLARREPQWYGPALDLLGLRLGVIQHDAAFLYSRERVSDRPGTEHLIEVPRRTAYEADITYGTNNEFGFDYLRDNMVRTEAERVQRSRRYAIVDEADSVLIDEARTPLVISGQQSEDLSIYPRFRALVPRLDRGVHYTVEERSRTVHLTEAGVEALERGLGIDNIYSEEHFRLTRYMEAALRAHVIFQRDRDYVVKDGQVVIVDEFTGRLMEGRRWSDGLHQAIEAKEGVTIRPGVRHLRHHHPPELLPPLRQARRHDRHRRHRRRGVPRDLRPRRARDPHPPPHGPRRRPGPRLPHPAREVPRRRRRGRLAARRGPPGARRHGLDRGLGAAVGPAGAARDRARGAQREAAPAEAAIIARAGQRGAVTIATNMAGRGTDIRLGDGVAGLGGLHIIGTERHESRRVDNQLRGRSGRQGDPGSSRFFVSFDDDIMRRFAPDWLPGVMSKLGMAEGMPLESKAVSRAIETAQGKVEALHFDVRKHVVEYDDVMNQHRDVIYGERDKVLAGESMRETVLGMIHDELRALAAEHLEQAPADPAAFRLAVEAIAPLGGDFPEAALRPRPGEEALAGLGDRLERRYAALEREAGEEAQRTVERAVLLATIDGLWVRHLTAVEELREGIGLRAYGQANPLVAYKSEAHDMWEQLLGNIRSAVARQLFHARVVALPPAPVFPPRPSRATAAGPGDEPAGGGAAPAAVRAVPKVGRNQQCPCGSGKKYKRCHGQAA